MKMWWVCTGFAQGLHRVYTGFAQGLHRVYTGFAQGLHRVCTGFAQGLHRVYTGFAQGLHRVCTRSASLRLYGTRAHFSLFKNYTQNIDYSLKNSLFKHLLFFSKPWFRRDAIMLTPFAS